ncbi:hypothetical protein ACFWY7_32005 [Streptomyces sp. NPDC059001]|uniref:hypothetical protein n=1 Tax=Streptomyces sp. NPDC059001 TaxID=3346689 RepID=UPI0036AA5160
MAGQIGGPLSVRKTFNFEPGVVFVTKDGAESEVVIGPSERVLDVEVDGSGCVSTGQV